MNTTAIAPSLAAALGQGDAAALDAALAHFSCVAGTVHRADGQTLRLACSRHIPDPVIALIGVVPFGKGIAGLAAERREPVCLCNLQTDTSGQARPAAKGTGMEGSIAVPMLAADGSVRGVLGIAKREAHDWTAAERAELLAFAARIA